MPSHIIQNVSARAFQWWGWRSTVSWKIAEVRTTLVLVHTLNRYCIPQNGGFILTVSAVRFRHWKEDLEPSSLALGGRRGLTRRAGLGEVRVRSAKGRRRAGGNIIGQSAFQSRLPQWSRDRVWPVWQLLPGQRDGPLIHFNGQR